MSELPPGWARATIAQVTQTVDTVNPKVDPESEFTYVDIGSIDNSVQIIAAPKVLHGAEAPSRARQLLRSGDTVFSTVRTYLRNIGYVEASLDGAVGSTGFVVLRPASGINSRYLYYHSLTNSFVDGLTADMRGTSYPAVVDSQVREMPIAIAPTAEQERIVAAVEEQFSRLDAGMSALMRIRRNIKRMRGAVLQAAVTGRFSVKDAAPVEAGGVGDDPLADHLNATNARKVQRAADDLLRLTWDIPPSWAWKSASDVCEVVASGSTPAKAAMTAGRGDVPYIKVYNLTHSGNLDFSVRPTFIDRATHEGSLRRSRLYPGDVLTNIVGPPLGKVAVVPNEYPEWNTNQAVVVFRAVPSIHPRLLMYWLLSPPVLKLLESTSRATAGQFNVSLTTCRALPLPIPPRTQQDALVAIIEDRLSLLDAVEAATDRALSLSSSLRASVLAAAFSGKLIAKDPSDEPASVLLERVAAERASANGHKSVIARADTYRKVTA